MLFLSRRRTLVLALALSSLPSFSQSIREQIQGRELEIYAVIFGITVGKDSELLSFRVSKVIDPTSGKDDAVTIEVPIVYVEAARKKASEKKYKAQIKEGKPEEFFTYYLYAPKNPSVVVTDLDRPLNQQP